MSTVLKYVAQQFCIDWRTNRWNSIDSQMFEALKIAKFIG